MLNFAIFLFDYSTSSTAKDILAYGFLFVRNRNFYLLETTKVII